MEFPSIVFSRAFFAIEIVNHNNVNSLLEICHQIPNYGNENNENNLRMI